jgi:hypothetical protein
MEFCILSNCNIYTWIDWCYLSISFLRDLSVHVVYMQLTVAQLHKKFLTFYRTWRFTAAFRISNHLSLSWTTSIQSMLSHQISLICVLLLYFHLSLDIPGFFFTSGLDTKTMYAFLLSHVRYNCPTHLVSSTNHESLRMPFPSVSYQFLSLRPS